MNIGLKRDLLCVSFAAIEGEVLVTLEVCIAGIPQHVAPQATREATRPGDVRQL